MSNSFINRAKPNRSRKSSRGASMRAPDVKQGKKFVFPKRPLLIVLGVVVLYLVGTNSHNLYEMLNTQKIEHIVIDGSLDYVSEEEVKMAVLGYVNQSLVAIRLDEMKRDLEANPWIKTVNIKREWPGTLLIDVKEEVAIARWGEKQLLNQEGEIFSPLTVSGEINFPYLSGPEGTQQEVMEQYQQFNQLLYPHGLKIANLELNSRDAWSIELESGIKVKVGKEEIMIRMTRFVDSIDTMFIEGLASINTVDLRYHNGIAVSKRVNANEEVVSL